ncbi:hypothetical protein Moror_16427 [Moniliophthora roreri MCA 2997]|uniref:Uncharacterized protein n=1 Tax=Moniliophthora roreri (strain MCA 2997) TaxID=1381753 RepID=V2XDK7_MONRO|nr:hypothetical protein Moror_16427 [Moniliophthora roreri MCA 2997]
MEAKPWLARLSGDSEESLLHPVRKSRMLTPGQRRRYLFAACISLTVISLIGLVSFSLWTTQTPSWTTQNRPNVIPTFDESIQQVPPPNQVVDTTKIPDAELDPLGPLAVLNGPPTAHFKNNLRPDLKYLTSWAASGWTNDVMAYANSIYLALITDRIPVMPVFTPSHIGGSVPPIAFGDVFDVPRLRKLLGKPVLEWRDVKDSKSEEVDDLGCWSVWEGVQAATNPRDSQVPIHTKLDISYTKTPDWVKLDPNAKGDPHATFWSLARLAFPDTRAENLVTPHPSPMHHVSLPPDEQMLCYDFLYYVGAHQPFEMERDYSPSWRYVAQHMHWHPSWERLADTYVNRALGFRDDEKTPPYIGIHVRHNDFQDWCFGVPLYDCFAKIPAIARRVQEVKDEIRSKLGIVVNHVVMTSDERNQTWWQEVAEQGWFWPDHSQTKEKYGDWYPPLIDAAIQSRGVGFVGTDRSTMSLVAKRRVENWYNGVTRMVRWGAPEADDH